MVRVGANQMSLQRLIKTMSFVLIVCSVLIVGGLVWLTMSYEEQAMAQARQTELKQLGLELGMSSDYLTNEARSYVQFGNRVHFDNYWREVNETKTRDRVVQRLQQLNAPADELALIEQAKQESDSLIKTEEAAFNAVQLKDLNKARELMFGDAYDKDKQKITGYVREFQEKMNTRAQNETEAVADATRMTLVGLEVLIVLFLITMVGMFVLLNRRLSKPLQHLTAAAEQVAQGDLTTNIEIRSKDEIGTLAATLQTMVVNLRELIGSINGSTDHVNASSQQLLANATLTRSSSLEVAAAMQEMAHGSDVQVRSSEEALTAMEEMATGILRIAETTATVTDASNETAVAAKQGNAIVNDVSRQMNSIHTSASRTAEYVQLLDTRSQEIGEIVAVITGIAAQTNLLALNAAIEAARAGEHGRGFAVVADEVRKLAEQSERSAAQITELIQEIQRDTARAVEAMTVSSGEVATGLTLVEEAGLAFQRILSAADHVAAQIQEISAASEEMSAGTEQVTASVGELTQVARQSSDRSKGIDASMQEQMASVEDMTHAIGRLHSVVDELQDAVRKFTV